MDDFEETLEEDPEDVVTINFKPSFVLIAIDTHPSMFQITKNDEGIETHPFKDALRACYEVADSLIFAVTRHNYNQFGIVLADEDGKASFIEVESNLLDTVKVLKEKSSLSNAKLKKDYERQADLDLAAFFLLCKKKFKEINASYYKRTIVFITNDENPVVNAQKRFTALNEAKTFEASDIQFELISMKDDFDYSLFYNELFSLYSKPPPGDRIDQSKDGWLVEKLSSSIIYRYTKLRYNFYPFKNDYTRYLKIMKMNFIRDPLLTNTDMASADGKLLKRVRENLGVDNPNPSCQYSLSMGDPEDPLEFDAKDQHEILENDLPLGLHLQYVSDRLSDVGVFIDNSSIITVDPKEDLLYFNNFWNYCASRNKVLICIKKYRDPAPIRYVELIPKYANNQELFIIKDLPFSDEIEFPKWFETAEFPTFEFDTAKSEGVKKLIEELTFDYDPKMFADPCYGKKKAYVKSKLLDEPLEKVEDLTLNVEQMDNTLEDVVNDIRNLFSLEASGKGKKRKVPLGNGARGKKAAK